MLTTEVKFLIQRFFFFKYNTVKDLQQYRPTHVNEYDGSGSQLPQI